MVQTLSPRIRTTTKTAAADAYNDDLEKKIKEISKIVVKPISSREDIQDTLLPVYYFLMGYAKELVDPKNGIEIPKEKMIEIFDVLNDFFLIQPLKIEEEKEEERLT